MIKPAFCIFCGLCILTSFSLLTVNVRGVSNKHCLLPFFHFYGLCILTSLFSLTITVRGVSNKHCLLPFFIQCLYDFLSWNGQNILHFPRSVSNWLFAIKKPRKSKRFSNPNENEKPIFHFKGGIKVIFIYFIQMFLFLSEDVSKRPT